MSGRVKLHVDAWAALSLLPRYKEAKKPSDKDWVQDAPLVLVNHALCPKEMDVLAGKVMQQVHNDGFEGTVQEVAVADEQVVVLHRHLRWVSLRWLFERNFSWQNWPKQSNQQRRDAKQIPTLLLYKGRYIVWNGTHRFTLCRLFNRKLRANVIDVEKFYQWVAENKARAKVPVKKRKVKRGNGK